IGDGSWLFPLVRRDGRHRRLAYLRGIARRAPHAGDRRIRRLSLLREDPGPICSGSWPWIRKRAHRCWSWMRPGSGDVFRRHAHGAIRMAPLLHRAWRRQHSLADSVVRMDAARKLGPFARGGKRRRIPQDTEATIDVGDLRGPIWRKLRAVLRDHLAAVLSGARAPLFDGNDGENWRHGIFVLRGCRGAFRLDFRPVDRRRWNADSRSQDFCGCGSGECRATAPGLRPRPSHGFRDSAATSVRGRRNVRIQYLGDHANSGRAENGRPMDGLAEFRWKFCRRHRTGSDRIRYRLHRTILRGFRDYGCRGTAGRSFLYLCYWPGEGDRLGTMT